MQGKKVFKRSTLKKGLVTVLVAVAAIDSVLSGAVTAKDLAILLVPVFGTYLAASYGASYAFKLQAGKEAVLAERSEVDALNRALMVLCLQYNEIAVTWKTMLEVGEEELVRMLNLPGYKAPQFDYRQNVVDLAFLMRFGDAHLILEISIEQGRFDACMASMEVRSKFFVETVEPLIAKFGTRKQALLSEQQVFKWFGELVYLTLRSMTNALYAHVGESEASLFSTIEKLHRTAKTCFPNEKFFRVERLDFSLEQASTA